jgi:hypothetical protein
MNAPEGMLAFDLESACDQSIKHQKGIMKIICEKIENGIN